MKPGEVYKNARSETLLILSVSSDNIISYLHYSNQIAMRIDCSIISYDFAAGSKEWKLIKKGV